MARTLRILSLAVLAAAAVGCSGSSSSASLQSGDIAVVDTIHITRDQLNNQIKLVLGSYKANSQTPPKTSTPEYQTQVIDQAVSQLVLAADVKLIAAELGVTVTDTAVNARIQAGIKSSYGGSQAKYRAALTKLGYTTADVFTNVQETLLETAIQTKLDSEVAVNDAAALAYYNKNKVQFTNTDDSREVDYILVPGKATAEKDLKELKAGIPQATVAKGAIDSNTLHQPVTPLKATSAPGSLEKNFQHAALTLPTGQWSPPVVVSQAYIKSQSSLKAKCKAGCYFLIYPTAPLEKKGSMQSFASVKAQIIAQLKSTTQSTHVQQRIESLLSALKKQTKYAQGYAPPASATTPATTSSTSTATS